MSISAINAIISTSTIIIYILIISCFLFADVIIQCCINFIRRVLSCKLLTLFMRLDAIFGLGTPTNSFPLASAHTAATRECVIVLRFAHIEGWSFTSTREPMCFQQFR